MMGAQQEVPDNLCFPRLRWQHHVADARRLQESTRLQVHRCRRRHPADLCQGPARPQELARGLRARCWLLHPSGNRAPRGKSTRLLFACLALPQLAAASIRLPSGLPAWAGRRPPSYCAPGRPEGRLVTRVEGTAACSQQPATSSLGCWMLVVYFWLCVVGCVLLVVGCWWPVAGGRRLVAGGWCLAPGAWRLAAGCWLMAHASVFRARACLQHSNFLKVKVLNTAPRSQAQQRSPRRCPSRARYSPSGRTSRPRQRSNYERFNRNNLLSQRHVAHLQRHAHEREPFRFRAANGGSTAPERIMLSADPLATSAEPYIMNSTQAVLSVGLRIRQGYSFVWLHGKQPCMIRPDGLAVVLEVKNDIPYLTKSRQHRDPGTQTKTKELCGVSSFDDVVRITLPQRNESSSEAAPASAIIGSSPEADADAVSEAAESVHSLVPRDCSSERGSEIGDYPEAETSTEEKPKKNVIETLRENVPGPQRDLDDALREFDYHCLARKPPRHASPCRKEMNLLRKQPRPAPLLVRARRPTQTLCRRLQNPCIHWFRETAVQNAVLKLGITQKRRPAQKRSQRRM